jgi:hypothetical protein
MSFHRLGPILFLALLAGVATASNPGDDFGVLVMAHGGSEEWNQGVLDAVEPLRNDYVIEVAFGMADAKSMDVAVTRLEELGVHRIGVVRLFVSGESWYERTEQIFGLVEGAPVRPASDEHAGHGGGPGGHSMEFWRIDSEASFALTTEGLSEADPMGAVLADRARELSRSPESEDVLILAHGPGDDAENERWIANIEARAIPVAEALPFRRVEVQTLREDWEGKRQAAEERILAFVQRAMEEDGQAIVIPYRVQGFGPYADVLEGLDYTSDGRGLVPHENVTNWIESQIVLLQADTFRTPIEPASASAESGHDQGHDHGHDHGADEG